MLDGSHILHIIKDKRAKEKVFFFMIHIYKCVNNYCNLIDFNCLIIIH